MASLPGAPVKLSLLVKQAITSAAKIHAGQLVELAKQVQIEELRDKVALEHPNKDPKPTQADPDAVTAAGPLSKAAKEELQKQIEGNLGPAAPWHMREARRRMIESGVFIEDKPKSMFLRK